ncbi:MAG: NUDIX hydrolase [Planctomycetes bacterium]|nr:NUDIX hydrolase [Planctomycetota bacterium]
MYEFSHCPRCGGLLELKRPPTEHRERQICRDCSFIFYQGLKVAAGTLPVRDGRLVLIRRGVEPGIGLWSFPCGYIEKDETLEAGAVRETLEETHLEVRLTALLGAYSYPPALSDSRVAVLAYLAEVVGGELSPGDDATDANYFSYEEIPWKEIAFRSTLDAIRDWRAHPATPPSGPRPA